MYDSHLKLEFREKQIGEWNLRHVGFMLHYSFSPNNGLKWWIFVVLFFIIQWVANPANDMYADTVTTVILEVQSNPKIQKGRKFSVCLFNWGISSYLFISRLFFIAHLEGYNALQ